MLFSTNGITYNYLSSDFPGWLAGPIVSGSIIDTSCNIWNTSRYGKGACALYDSNDFRWKILTFHTMAVFISLCILVCAFFRARNKTDWSTEEISDTADNCETAEPMLILHTTEEDKIQET